MQVDLELLQAVEGSEDMRVLATATGPLSTRAHASSTLTQSLSC